MVDRSFLGTEVVLPSKGLLYDGIIPGGVVVVSPMSTKEEKRMSATKSSDAMNAIDGILERCVSLNGLPPSELLSGDRFFLLNILRAVSYGSEYEFSLNCELCSQRFNRTVNVTELPTISFEDGYTEPFFVDLPISEARVGLRSIRGKDEQAIAKFTEQRLAKNMNDQGDVAFAYRVAKQITSVEGKDVNINTETSEGLLSAVVFYEDLLVPDAEIIRQALRDQACGVDSELLITCPGCRGDFTVTMPYRSEFFRPGRRRK